MCELTSLVLQGEEILSQRAQESEEEEEEDDEQLPQDQSDDEVHQSPPVPGLTLTLLSRG